MKLSIIIVNYRAWGHIATALDSLLPGFPEDWEVVIVDNASDPDALAEFAGRYDWPKLVPNPANSGFGMGCILGVEAASGERLLFMNPDVIATSDQVRTLLAEKASDPSIGIIAPAQVGVDGRPQKVFDEFPGVLNQSRTLKLLIRHIAPSRHPDPRAAYSGPVYCDWVTGSFLLIDRDDYDRIGGWSRDYWMYSEDADLCQRARDAGLRVVFTPAVTVVHVHGGSSRINVDVKSLTKLEVIISKHVYIANHMRGPRRMLAHAMVGLVRVPGLVLAALLNLLTAGRAPALRVRTRMLGGLAEYYGGVLRSGCWLSPRARANQP